MFEIVAERLHIKGRCLITMDKYYHLPFDAGFSIQERIIIFFTGFEGSLVLLKGVYKEFVSLAFDEGFSCLFY
jgi:hypothetical protein